MRKSFYHKFLLLFALLVACGRVNVGGNVNPSAGNFKVVATTTIIGDVVSNVGRDSIELSVLLPAGSDPHGFDPTTKDISTVADADIVFMNGIALEGSLDDMLQSARGDASVVAISDGIDLITLGNGSMDENDEEYEHDHAAPDPHVWFDPNNVVIWAENILDTLSELNPDDASIYRSNSDAYITALQELDTWVEAQIAQIPEENHKLVTDHDSFGDFGSHYEFEIVGAVIPGYSTVAEPAAQELAELEEAIIALGVKAIFVGTTINPSLAERVAEDTGVQVIPLYTRSLNDSDGPAATYLDMMRHNVTTILGGLK